MFRWGPGCGLLSVTIVRSQAIVLLQPGCMVCLGSYIPPLITFSTNNRGGPGCWRGLGLRYQIDQHLLLVKQPIHLAPGGDELIQKYLHKHNGCTGNGSHEWPSLCREPCGPGGAHTGVCLGNGKLPDCNLLGSVDTNRQLAVTAGR